MPYPSHPVIRKSWEMLGSVSRMKPLTLCRNHPPEMANQTVFRLGVCSHWKGVSAKYLLFLHNMDRTKSLMGYAKSCRTEQNVPKKPLLNGADDSDRKQDHFEIEKSTSRCLLIPTAKLFSTKTRWYYVEEVMVVLSRVVPADRKSKVP